jgi:hypothetical protein
MDSSRVEFPGSKARCVPGELKLLNYKKNYLFKKEKTGRTEKICPRIRTIKTATD